MRSEPGGILILSCTRGRVGLNRLGTRLRSFTVTASTSQHSTLPTQKLMGSSELLFMRLEDDTSQYRGDEDHWRSLAAVSL